MKQIIGLGFLAASAYAALKSDSNIKSNPSTFNHQIPDKDFYPVIAAVSYFIAHRQDPNEKDFFPERIMNHIIREGFFDRQTGHTTQKGKDFLSWSAETRRNPMFVSHKKNSSSGSRNIHIASAGEAVGVMSRGDYQDVLKTLSQWEIADISDIMAAGVKNYWVVIAAGYYKGKPKIMSIQAFSELDAKEMVDKLQDQFFPEE